MYVTRPVSLYGKSPEALEEAPPPGPASGFLVIQDDEFEARQSCFFGLLRNSHLRDLPFPQDRPLRVGSGKHGRYHVFNFIPVINQPLSSNRYYVIIREGEHKGKVLPCPTEADKVNCCCCMIVGEGMPREFDSKDIFQEVEIISHCPCTCCALGCFGSKSVSPQGYTPPISWMVEPDNKYSASKTWTVRTLNRYAYPLTEASGIDELLRESMPDVSFSDASSYHSTPVVVGRWYCPFIFVSEAEMSLAHQVDRSGYYEMLLEQFWQQIYECDNRNQNRVKVNVTVQTKKPLLYVDGTVQEVAGDTCVADDKGIEWFEGRKRGRVGLRVEVVDRMRWEEERGGWIEKDRMVEKVEEVDGNGWRKFKCYILVERFVLRRMDGTLLLTYDFNHTNKITCKWI